MKQVKYPESIFCAQCQSPVEMRNCRMLARKSKGQAQVEIDYVCVTCGHRASATRDWDYLQFSERDFCQSKGLVLAGGVREALRPVYIPRKHPKY
jgi:hypothetical protein